jgi:hypothetical protein
MGVHDVGCERWKLGIAVSPEGAGIAASYFASVHSFDSGAALRASVSRRERVLFVDVEK